jgi:hypothetical protein
MKMIYGCLLVLMFCWGCSTSGGPDTATTLAGVWSDGGNLSYEFARDNTGVCNAYGASMPIKWSPEKEGKIRIDSDNGTIVVELKNNELVFGNKIYRKTK